jgi:hypothetical protein
MVIIFLYCRQVFFLLVRLSPFDPGYKAGPHKARHDRLSPYKWLQGLSALNNPYQDHDDGDQKKDMDESADGVALINPSSHKVKRMTKMVQSMIVSFQIEMMEKERSLCLMVVPWRKDVNKGEFCILGLERVYFGI